MVCFGERIEQGRGWDPTLSCVVLGCWGVGQAGSPGELQLPAAHLPETLDEVAGILRGQFSGLVAELSEAGLEAACRGEVVALVFGAAGEQFAADAVELAFHLDVPGEVERLEIVDELHETV